MAEKTDKWISDIIGALRDPIIAFPGGWGEDIPEELKTAITLERLVMNINDLHGEEPTGTDAEACAYLMTVSLTQPLDGDWIQIYLYVAYKYFSKWHKGEIPKDIVVDSINDYQQKELNRLKEWLYHQRTEARQKAERVEKGQKKEKEIARRKAEQQVMFEF